MVWMIEPEILRDSNNQRRVIGKTSADRPALPLPLSMPRVKTLVLADGNCENLYFSLSLSTFVYPILPYTMPSSLLDSETQSLSMFHDIRSNPRKVNVYQCFERYPIHAVQRSSPGCPPSDVTASASECH